MTNFRLFAIVYHALQTLSMRLSVLSGGNKQIIQKYVNLGN